MQHFDGVGTRQRLRIGVAQLVDHRFELVEHPTSVQAFDTTHKGETIVGQGKVGASAAQIATAAAPAPHATASSISDRAGS